MNTSCCQESNKQKKTCRLHSLVSFLPQKIWMFQDLEDKIIQAFIPLIPVAVKRVISRKKLADFILWSNFSHINMDVSGIRE